MRFFVSSPPDGVNDKHVVTCDAVPAPSIERCNTKAAAERLANLLNHAYGAWARGEEPPGTAT